MSRYYGDGDNPIGYVWDSIVERAIRGKRGQQNLRDLEAALLKMEDEDRARLLYGDLCREGEVCAVGALARERLSPEEWRDRVWSHWDDYRYFTGMMHTATPRRRFSGDIVYDLDIDCPECVDEGELYETAAFGESIGLQKTLAMEISVANDERGSGETPENRWARMLLWVQSRIYDFEPVPA